MSEESRKTERVWLCSAKGGVGVGFVTVNLALSLCRRGKRVLLVDGSPFCRSLDTVLACEADVIYDICDLAADRVTVDKALLYPLGEDGPALLPGAFSGEDAPSAKELCALLDRHKEALDFDYILVDAPALPESLAASEAYDRVLVVSDTGAASLRAAETVGAALRAAGYPNAALLLNRFSLLAPRESGQAPAIAMVDAACLPLIGIIPTVGELDESAHRYVGRYPLLTGRAFRRENALFAFDNLAARLAGEHTPLLMNVRAVRPYRRKLLY